MTPIRLALSIAIAGFIAAASAARDEAPQVDHTGPSRDLAASAVFDEARGALVVVGTRSSAADSLETWLFADGLWTRAIGESPPARTEPYLAYDRARQQVILHGGSRTAPNDTWEWGGAAWHRLATDGPPARSGAAMSYDASRRRIVLFGGRTSVEPGATETDETWEWDGSRWTRMLTAGPGEAPPGRILHAMAYDDARGRTVVFGGVRMATTSQPESLGDTWQWDGRTWTRIDNTGPGARDHVAMVYDPGRRGLVLHGGNTTGQGVRHDTWLFDGTRWSLLSDEGPARYRHQLVYDSRAGAVVSYGGLGPDGRTNEMWRLIASRWSRIAPS